MVSTQPFDTIGRVAKLLAELEHPWRLVGGLAVSVYVDPHHLDRPFASTSPRPTIVWEPGGRIQTAPARRWP